VVCYKREEASLKFYVEASVYKKLSLIVTAVFWNVAPRSLVEVYERYIGGSCLHLQRDDSLTV
jgi:hypothetical protein